MLGLKLPTDPRWVNLAEKSLEEILTDHAYCEQKAATSCITLIQSFPDMDGLVTDQAPIGTECRGPFRLVLNELVSNSLKYAFKDGRKGELTIILKKEPQHLLLKVSDNGTGYPEGSQVREGKSFGMKMIRAFAQKLKARLDVYNNNGAVVEMQISKYQLA